MMLRSSGINLVFEEVFLVFLTAVLMCLANLLLNSMGFK